MRENPVLRSIAACSRWSLHGISLLALSLSLLLGCKGDVCEGGTCSCPVGGSCEFSCEEPPCHVSCAGDNAACTGECANGECHCGEGSSCEFGCKSPPCHVNCEGTECKGVCANGQCRCQEGSSCDFRCDSGPCHLLCDGNNERCDGQCQNGSCTCGPDSSCSFECLDNNCAFSCASGSACVARCAEGTPGQQGCSFTLCAAGDVTLCPDGETQVCGTSCPPQEGDEPSDP